MKKISILSIASLAMCASFSPVFAKDTGVTHDLKDKETIAIINGKRVPSISAKIMVDMINRGKEKVSLGAFMQGAIENVLLVEHLRKNNELESAFRENRVGFDTDIAVEDQYVNVVRVYFEKELVTSIEEKFKGGTLESAVTKPFKMTPDELLKHTKLKSRGTLGFIPEQEEASKKVVLMEYKFPDQKEAQTITLYDIYRRQNIQGKDSLHKADIGYVENQLRQRLGSLYVHHWMDNHSGLSELEVSTVKDFVYNKHFKKEYLVTQGLANILHVDNHRAAEVAKTIPQKDVEEYFEANKEDYRVVTKAKGRIIRSNDQKAMEAAYEKLQKGADFNKIAAEYTDHKDKNGKPIIDTGWITRKGTKDLWLQTLLYTQPLDKASRPFRSPQTRGPEHVYWQMVIVDDREMGYQKPDADGVRYEIAKILAEKKLAEEYYELRDKLFSQSRIQLNPDVIGLKKKKTGPKSKGI